jgi:hypothetical protein
MTPRPKYGRATFAPVKVLPELIVDFSDGLLVAGNLGKTETPVRVLPEMSCDFAAEEATPVLQLNVSLRPGATPGQVALDMFRLYAAVNGLELSYGGAGLVVEDTLCDAGRADGTLQLAFKPTDPEGAAERLGRVVSTITPFYTAGNNTAASETLVLQFPTIERCEAEVVKPAA